MPIFEYQCKDCGKNFEAIVLGSQEAECPACKSHKLEQQLSTFAVSTPSSASSAPCGAPARACTSGAGGG